MIDSNNKLKSLSKSLIESAKQIMSEKKTDKDLAKLAPPYDKVTHGDVLVGRKVYTHDQVKAHKAKKGIKEDADMVVVNAPVLADIDGELAEVLKRDPRDKTVHIQLEGMKYVLKVGQYTELDEAVKNPYAVGMAAAMKSTGDTPPLKKSTITKAHEIAKKVAEEVEQIDEVNVNQIKKDLDSGMSHDAVIGKHANKRTTNTDAIRKVIKQHAWDKRMKKEEVEDLDELSTDTLQSYRKKARAQGNAIVDKMKMGGGDWSKDQKDTNTLRKRAAGAQTSGKQLVKRGESLKTEEVEDLEEAKYNNVPEKRVLGYHKRLRDSLDDKHNVHFVKMTKSAKVDIDHFHGSKDEAPALKKFHRGQHDTSNVNLPKGTTLTHHRESGDYFGYHPKHGHFKVAYANRDFENSVRKPKAVKEEVEQIDELSPATLGSYIKKAKTQMSRSDTVAGRLAGDRMKGGKPSAQERKHSERANKRYFGIDKAVDRLTKEEAELDELYKTTLKSYIKKAGRQAANADDSAEHLRGLGDKWKDKMPKNNAYAAADKHAEKSEKRLKGIRKAVGKLDRGEYEPGNSKLTREEVELDEASRGASPIAGTRLVSKHEGKDGHHAEVRYNPDWQEYSVHHYHNGKHLGEGPVSYHGEGKEGKSDATETAEHTIKNYHVKGGKLTHVKEDVELDEGYTIRSKGHENVEVVHKGKVVGRFNDPHSARMHIAKLNKNASVKEEVELSQEEIENIEALLADFDDESED